MEGANRKMTNKRRLRNLCAQLLAMILAFSMLLPASAAAVPVAGGNGNISDQSDSENAAALGETEAVNGEEAAPDPEEPTRILVRLKAEGALGAGYPAEDIVENEEAMAYTAELTEKQNAMAEAIDNDLYGGSGEFTVWSNLTLVVNAFEAIVKYGDIEKIGAYLSEKYPDDFEEIYTYSTSDATGTAAAETVSADPVSASATKMVGAAGEDGAWKSGYTGAGQLIAIIDTGLETTHPSFDPEALQYSLDELKKQTGKNYKLYEANDFANVVEELQAYTRYSRSKDNPQASDFYINKKIPFAFNYEKRNTEINNATSAGAEHGMHVAGIAAANKYVKNTGSDEDERPYVPQEKDVVGVAPDAQLVIMKVSDATASEYDYFPAIEDAIKLGCDAINVSLASNEPGRSWFFDKSIYGSQYATVFDTMVKSGSVVACGAGNMGYWSYYTRADQDYGLNYSEDIPMATGGYPGSFTNTLCVAAAYNTVVTGSGSTFNDCFTVIRDNDQEKIGIQRWESLNTAEDPSIGVDIPYVFLGDPTDKNDTKKYGGPEAYEGIDVEGKIVVVSRGGTPEEGFDGNAMSFPYKHEQAEEHGAKACLIYNNVSTDMGIIALENSTAKIPCASITLDDKERILQVSEKDAQNLYGGIVHIDNVIKTSPGPKEYQITEFSSWGTTGNLAIKPEVTAPGGNIYSTVPTSLGSYATMSGTSMATPSIAGQSVLIAQRLKEAGIVNENGSVDEGYGFETQRALVTSLMMSTATPLTDPENDDNLPYPVRQQGAGLANVGAATRSKAYIIMGEDATDSWADGKVKAELGDDADRDGKYTFSFKIKNISDSELTYTFDPIVMTPLVIEDEAKGHKYMTYTDTELSSTVTFAINGESGRKAVTVPGNGETEVTVTITLSEEDKALFEENNPKGAYVEGYIKMVGEVDLSVPFLAFYGNFSEPSMFDRATINTYDAETNPSYVTADGEDPLNYLNAIEIYGDGDIVGDIKLGKNLFAEEDAFIPERNMTVPLNTQIWRVSPSFIRVPAIVQTVVSARKTESEPFAEFWSRYTWGRPAYFNFSTGNGENPYDSIRIQTDRNDTVDQYERPVDIITGPSFWHDTWDGKDKDKTWDVTGTDGAQLEIKVVAPPELYTTIDENGIPTFEESELAEGAIWRTVITVDGQDPEIKTDELRYMWDEDGAHLLVPVLDNRYTAAVLVFNTDVGGEISGELLRMPSDPASEDKALQRIAVNQEEPGAEMAVDVPLENVESNSLLIVAVDYAGNYVSQEVTLPNLQIGIDYKNETLTGFDPDHEYTINGEPVEPGPDGTLDIPPEWLGTELDIVDTTSDSAIPQRLPVPARPQAPGGLSAGTTSTADSADGSVRGLDTEREYEYRTEDGEWTAVESGADSIPELGVGKYYVRFAATDDAFASSETEVEVKVYVAPPPPPGGNVTVAEPAGGTVDSSVKSAREGSTVTVTPKPGRGYITGGVTVTDANGGAVDVTEQEDGTYTFTMPKGNVTVEAQFLTPAQYYTDSPAGWYAEALAFVTNEGLMNGVSASPRRFAPDATLTRGMLVTILWRLDGEKTAAASGFTDVKADQWYTDAIDWAAANGVVNGYNAERFGPDDPVTREQMAAILYRYAGYKGYGVSNMADLSGYTDADSVSGWASTAMRWIVAEGIIKGTSTTTLAPVCESTRAQVATVLMRFCEGVAK